MTFKIIKKDNRVVEFDSEKIKIAITKSASRANVELSEEDKEFVCTKVIYDLNKAGNEYIQVAHMHPLVMSALREVSKEAADCYQSYRNYKENFVDMMDEILRKHHSTRYYGDRSNANADSSLVSTQRAILCGEISKEIYKKFYLSIHELQAINDGYIYIHDLTHRLTGSFNCCVMDAAKVMNGGFEMGNVWYNEPKTVGVACDVLGDIIMSSASNQYGGHTVKADDILAPYCQKSFDIYYSEYIKMAESMNCSAFVDIDDKAKEYALGKTIEELEQGLQGLEYKLNTVVSARGDFVFTTFAFGDNLTKWGLQVSSSLLKVRKNGQGKPGHKRPMVFPKLTMIYRKEWHDKGAPYEWLFDEAIDCSSKSQYPDYISCHGNDFYEKYGISPISMGCRSFPSLYYKEGGLKPSNDKDTPVMIGRSNIGVCTLNLIMIYKKSQEENRPFYDVLDEYLEMIREVHKKTYEYLGGLKASCNPLMFCYGGLMGGNLNPDDVIAPVLKQATASFGFLGLNELQMMYNGKMITEDNDFVYDVLKYIYDKVEEYKSEDGYSYSVYGTPAESLAGKQVEQYTKKYGTESFLSHGYLTNSFHMPVYAKISGIEKQNLENKFWSLSPGGRIQYVRYPDPENINAIKATVRSAMNKGYYEGVNIAQCFCEDCGDRFNDAEECPKCKSSNITKIDRVCGYLGYTKVKGNTRMCDSKNLEIFDRVSM